ncbi:hypothetical protein [Solilutibacter silvestris]|uniref:hypothetical protein n=1 Tax=Solilutibacter silvestris TaxID=1645665 RepID=UPI003D32D810
MLANQKLAKAHYLIAAVWLIVSVVIAFLVQRDAGEALRTIAYFSVVPILHIVIGGVCETGRILGKMFTIGLAAVELILFPIGTILGGILLWLCIPSWEIKAPSRNEELAKGWPRG